MNESVVAALTDALERAKSGDLIAYTIAARMADGTTMADTIGPMECPHALFALELARHRLLAAADEQNSEPRELLPAT